MGAPEDGCTILYSYQKCTWVLVSLSPYQHLVLSVFLLQIL